MKVDIIIFSPPFGDQAHPMGLKNPEKYKFMRRNSTTATEYSDDKNNIGMLKYGDNTSDLE